jgi:hypothetical protein
VRRLAGALQGRKQGQTRFRHLARNQVCPAVASQEDHSESNDTPQRQQQGASTARARRAATVEQRKVIVSER